MTCDRVSSCSLIACLLLTVVLSVSCSTTRPDTLSDWDACTISQAGLSPQTYGLDVVAGSDSVLYLAARWDENPTRSEYQFGQLLLTLQGELAAGTTLQVDTPGTGLGQYREGGQIVTYESDTLTGAVMVVEVGSGSAVLELDLVAASPTTGTGPHPLQGQVHADVVSQFTDCD